MQLIAIKFRLNHEEWKEMSVELPESLILAEQMTETLVEKKIKSYVIRD